MTDKTLRAELVPLIRMLASENDQEVLAAVRAIKRKLAAHDADLNDLADEFAKPRYAVTHSHHTIIVRAGKSA